MNYLKTAYKIDENGDVWVLIPAINKKFDLPSRDDAVIKALAAGLLTGKMTATEIAVRIGITEPSKADTNGIARQLRALGIRQSRSGTGKYFIFSKQNPH